MIYGATGYTGRMVAEHAKGQGMDIVIAGRNAEQLELTCFLGGPLGNTPPAAPPRDFGCTVAQFIESQQLAA